MLSARASLAPTICLPCRLRLFATLSTRHAIRNAGVRTIEARRLHSMHASSRTSITPVRERFRAFATHTTEDNGKNVPGTEETDGRAPLEEDASAEEDAEEVLAGEEEGVADSRTVEERAEEARILFGESVPEGWLSEDEMLVYKRLYGSPAKMEEELDEPILEETRGNAIFKAGEQGEYEEVDMEELDEMAAEDVEVDPTTKDPNQRLAMDIQAAMDHGVISSEEVEDVEVEDEYEDADELVSPGVSAESARAHPITRAGRFATNPSTLQLSAHGYTKPVEHLLSNISSKHIMEAARKYLGGASLDHSPAVPPRNAKSPQKPIGISAEQSQMGPTEADAFLAAVMPPTYASAVSTLVEVRRRLGSEWIEGLLKKEGGPRVLDVGGGGAGILAWRDVVNAEWDRMREEDGDARTDQDTSTKSVPYGRSTVLTGSPVLRQRISSLLENTSFLPRLPERVNEATDAGAVHSPDPNDPNAPQQKRRRYDIIIAPHSILPLKEDWERRKHVQTLWSLLVPKGGVLILLEKGMPRGFEAVAGARKHLLDRIIKSPGNETFLPRVDESPSIATTNTSAEVEEHTDKSGVVEKETGMILAPCTNHNACPMYKIPGLTTGRKDFCHFSQRFIRPKFYSRVLGREHSGSNHEDAQFSFLAVQRGVDMRQGDNPAALFNEAAELNQPFAQDEAAYESSFDGYEDANEPVESAEESDIEPSNDPVVEAEVLGAMPHPLTLPRNVMPPLKRHGHIIMDLCTPRGTLERWTIPRSFSRQAFRDARKARWGDLWGLGAKTRIPKTVRLGKKGSQDEILARLEGVEKSKGKYGKKSRVVAREARPRASTGETAPTDKSKAGRMVNLEEDKEGNIKLTRSGVPKLKPYQRRALEREERRNAKRGRSSMHESRQQDDEDEPDDEDVAKAFGMPRRRVEETQQQEQEEAFKVWGRRGGKSRFLPGKDEQTLLEEMLSPPSKSQRKGKDRRTK